MAGEFSNRTTPPVREDCWSEEATSTLIEAWGKRFMEMNRGNLRQKDWQEVADDVNSLHGHSHKTHRTHVQCKNRIDTIKKKFKSEKAKIDESNGAFTSSWRFYKRVEFLIGPSLKYLSRNTPLLTHPPTLKRNYSVMAAAAAAASEEDEQTEEKEKEMGEGDEDGWKSLAKSIEGFGQVYERVESMKMKQMLELEKQRIKFAKDLEFQRMKMFLDMQVQLQKTRVKRGGSDDDIYN